MRNPEWTQEDNLHILYLDAPDERYILDLENKDIRKEYLLMGDWEEATFDFNFFPPTLEEAKEFIETEVKNQEIAEKEFEAEIWRQYFEELDRKKEERDLWKKNLKGLINTKRLWEDMEEFNDYWGIDGIVEVTPTNEQIHGYPRHECGRIKDEKGYLYMKCNSDVKYIDHYYIWQTSGYLGDDYSGFCLYPLKDGKYLKISYSC